MSDPAIKHGRKTGFRITAILSFNSILIVTFQVRQFTTHYELVAQILVDFIFCYLLFAWIGLILGEQGAKSKSVPRAFFRGGVLLGCISLVFYLPLALLALGGGEFVPISVVFSPIILYAIVFGAIVSGVSAIAARDFRRFQKARFLPQFSLQELFITFSLITVLVSILSSIRFFGNILANW
jgi:hypothetical protein